MKFNLLFSLIFTFLLTEAFSQITIADNDGNDLTNTTALLPVSPQKVYYNITNQGASDITFIVQVVSYTIPEDANNILVCACGSCLPVSPQSVPLTIGSPTFLAAGETYGNNQADVEYDAGGCTDPANITIKVFEQGNESNYAQFTLDTEYSAINSLNENNFSIYPNPASGFFSINLPDNDSEIIISNVLGKMIKRIHSSDHLIQMNGKDFDPGIYFVSTVQNNKISSTKKLIIK